MTDPLAATYYSVQAATATTTVQRLAALWRGLSLTDIDRSWAVIRPQVLLMVSAGQLRAASTPALYAAQVLALDGFRSKPDGVVPPSAFVGWTSAGLPLDVVLDTAPMQVKLDLTARRRDPLASGLVRLSLIGKTEVADAGRGAMETVLRLEPHLVGYERHVNLPACGRCTLLAGRFYRHSAGFQRHPGCDCTHRPVTRRERDEGTDQVPSRLFEQMTREQQDAAFTQTGADAIRSGADVSQVVNARRGMSVPGDLLTREGTTRRGAYGRTVATRSGTTKRPGERYGRTNRARLSPQGVARLAGDDPSKYRELLAANGYLA